jgi:hypothetical protein
MAKLDEQDANVILAKVNPNLKIGSIIKDVTASRTTIYQVVTVYEDAYSSGYYRVNIERLTKEYKISLTGRGNFKFRKNHPSNFNDRWEVIDHKPIITERVQRKKPTGYQRDDWYKIFKAFGIEMSSSLM